ncbi:MAG: LUD domain-containing protein [Alphaproteobacteria bacterium]|nr:LUD domain-containing protein [Alphaproteobacteria bacterium]
MSKAAILTAIRRNLLRGPVSDVQAAMLQRRLAAHPRHLVPARSRLPRPDQAALFVRNVEKEFGTVARLPDAGLVPAAVADYLVSQNLAPELTIAPHPELRAIPWAERPLLRLRDGRGAPTDAVGVQYAFAAVAETGTLVLPSGPEQPTTLNILPETAILVLRASRLVGAYEEAWDLLRAEWKDAATGGFMPRSLMLITGPSRSADIESTLELGAHGPRRLHVLLLDDDPTAIPPQPALAGA